MADLPPLLLPGDYPSLRISPFAADAVEKCMLDVYDDTYANIFYKHSMCDASGGRSVLSVLASPESQTEEEQVHLALKTFPKGYEKFSLTIPKGPKKTLSSRLEEALKEKEKKEMYDIFDNSAFSQQFLNLEMKHPQKRTQFKVGMMYVREGQVHAKQWFSNLKDLDPRFWEMMDVFGKRIDLKEWKGYRGDMGGSGETFFDHWHDEIDVMYHLSPLLNSEGHRRLIGNDIGVIFFVEENAQFSPAFLNDLGTVPQVYALIQPVKDKWRLAFFSNINIKYYGPSSPERLLTIEEAKEMVLTNIYNGLTMTQYCPPINRLFYVPREATLDTIIKEFPYITPKERKAIKGAPSPSGSRVQVSVIAAKNVAALKQGILYDVNCVVSVEEQKEKTKAVASQYPVWNSAMWFLINGDAVFCDVIITVYRNSIEYIGQITMPVSSLQAEHEEPKWYKLQNDENAEEVAGEIFVAFSYKPGKNSTEVNK